MGAQGGNQQTVGLGLQKPFDLHSCPPEIIQSVKIEVGEEEGLDVEDGHDVLFSNLSYFMGI